MGDNDDFRIRLDRLRQRQNSASDRLDRLPYVIDRARSVAHHVIYHVEKIRDDVIKNPKSLKVYCLALKRAGRNIEAIYLAVIAIVYFKWIDSGIDLQVPVIAMGAYGIAIYIYQTGVDILCSNEPINM